MRYLIIGLFLSFLALMLTLGQSNLVEAKLSAYLYTEHKGEVEVYLKKHGFIYKEVENGFLIEASIDKFKDCFGLVIEGKEFSYSIPQELKGKIIALNIMNTSSSYTPLVEQVSDGFPPSQVLSFYGIDRLHQEGYKGQGLKIAIVVAYGNSNASDDLRSFSQYFNLPDPSLQVLYPQGKPSSEPQEWAMLSNLVLQWSHAIAPLASKYLIIAKDDGASLEDAMIYALSKDYNIVIFPFGKNESIIDVGIANYISYKIKQAVNAGTLVVAPIGSAGLLLYPSTDPNVLSVGGTIIQGSSELSWQKSQGSKSSMFKRPPWQSWLSESEGRAFPDISFVASGFKVFYKGSMINLAGTSASASQIGSLMALSFQIANRSLENLNMMLYEIYLSNFYRSLFNDIAPLGWDYSTGLGSPKAYSLAHFLAREFLRVSLNYVNASYSPYVLLNGQKYYLPINLNLMRNATYQLKAQEFLEAGSFQRYAFKAWQGSLNSSSIEISLNVNKEYDLLLIYKIQHRVVVNTSYGKATGEGWYDENSVVNISINETVHYISNYTRALFVGWKGEGNDSYTGNSTYFSITIKGWVIENAIWKIQHLVEIVSKFENSSSWVDAGSTFKYTINDSFYISSNERYFLKKWLILLNRTIPSYIEGSPEISLIVNAPLLIEPLYSKQYKLVVDSNIEGPKKSGMIAGEGWYDEGSYAYFSSPSIIYSEVNLTRYIALEVYLDGNKLNGSLEGYVKMDRPHVVLYIFKTQHYVNASSKFYRVEGSGWYDEGSNATIIVYGTAYYLSNDTRYYLKGFNISNYLEFQLGSIASFKIKVDRPMNLVAIWVLQYYVHLHNLYGNVKGEGWHDEGTLAKIEAIPYYLNLSKGIRLAFYGWSINGVEYNGNLILVNSPIKAEAVYKTENLVEFSLLDLNGREIKEDIQIELSDSLNNLYYISNRTAWLKSGELWKLNRVLIDGRYFYPSEEVKFFLSSPVRLTVTLNIVDFKIMAKSLFGSPVKDMEIEVRYMNGYFKTHTNEEGIAKLGYVDPSKTSIKYSYFIFQVEENLGSSGIKTITVLTASDLFIISFIAILVGMFVLVRKLLR